MSTLDRILQQTTPAALDKLERTGTPPAMFAVTLTTPTPIGDASADAFEASAGPLYTIDLTEPMLAQLRYILSEGMNHSTWRPPAIRALLARLRSLAQPTPTLVVPAPTTDNCLCSSTCQRLTQEPCPHV